MNCCMKESHFMLVQLDLGISSNILQSGMLFPSFVYSSVLKKLNPDNIIFIITLDHKAFYMSWEDLYLQAVYYHLSILLLLLQSIRNGHHLNDIHKLYRY